MCGRFENCNSRSRPGLDPASRPLRVLGENMKSHLTTIILTVVVTLLVSNFLLPKLQSVPAEAQAGRFSGIQFMRSEGSLWFFDTRSGDIWIYDEARKLPVWHLRLPNLGAPIEKLSLSGKTLEQIRAEAIGGASPT